MSNLLTSDVLADRMIGLMLLEPEEIQKQITKIPNTVKGFTPDASYLEMTQSKETAYGYTVFYRRLLLAWLGENPKDEIFGDRMKLLDNVNKRLEIYNKEDYSMEKDASMIESLFKEYDNIPNKFLGLNEGNFTYDEIHETMKEKLSRMDYERDAMYDLVIESRTRWLEELKSDHLKLPDLRIILEKEIKLLDKIVSFYESPEYSIDDEEQWGVLYKLLEQTTEYGTEGPNFKELYEKNFMAGDKTGISKEFNYYGVVSVKRGMDEYLRMCQNKSYDPDSTFMKEYNNISELVSIYESDEYSLDDINIVKRLSKLIRERDAICIAKQNTQTGNTPTNSGPDISNIMEILLKGQANSST